MSGNRGVQSWLERARRALGWQEPEPPPPEPFCIRCPCGRRVNGVRLQFRQFLSCAGCGRTLFVLPRSPYPVPAPPPPVSAPAGPEGAGPAVAAPAGAAGRRARLRLRARTRLAKRRLAQRSRALVPPRRWFSRGRLVAAATLLIIAGTVAASLYFARRDRLTTELLAAQQRWTAALDAGDFAAAKTELVQATELIRRYGKGGQGERRIQQLAREVAVLADRLEDSLPQLLARLSGQRPDERDRFIADQVRGRTVILDLFLPTEADGQAEQAGTIALLVAGQPLYLDLAGLQLPAGVGSDRPLRLLLGVRIQGLEPAAGPGSGWVLRFEPDSAVLLTTEQVLVQAGWPVDEQVASVLQSQQEWLEAED